MVNDRDIWKKAVLGLLVLIVPAYGLVFAFNQPVWVGITASAILALVVEVAVAISGRLKRRSKKIQGR
jgi:membrane protein YdbS with pleckstrin-like domain